MSVVHLGWDEPPPAALRGGVVAIGNFDGVHLGHAALLAELLRLAATTGGPAVAVTFDPHPLQLLRPEHFQPILTTIADRAALIGGQGVSGVIALRTTPALLRLSAREFFTQVVRGRLDARAMVEGTSFCFGRDREGTIDTLMQLCRQSGIQLKVVPPLTRDGQPVSSSRVRRALERGAVREAADLLGRPYRLRGTVGVGQNRGRALGFPTANLEGVETVVPHDGVYAVRVHFAGGCWPGAANVGPNPTFGEQARKVEVHVIGFDGSLYGQVLAVDFLERLRDTRPFSGPAELIAQLRADVEQAVRIAGEGQSCPGH